MNPTMRDPRAWVEVTPDYTNLASDRSPTNYVRAMEQFQVLTNPRYVRGHDGNPANGEETYCNIYLWDVTKALDCEVAHWVDPATGVEVPMGKGKELNANGVCDWFTAHGLAFNWMRCGSTMATSRASSGYPTVVLWKNLRGIGHVAMVMPSPDPRQVRISQAGAHNLFNVDITKGFGGINQGLLMFYTHD